ncbi:MAG: hypothetical protein PSV13_16820 [Lacunisphaera sp.]|nr:hypothetical protein [Lacunisphaera sp.]
MKRSRLVFIGLMFCVSQLCGADCVPPPNYKKKIEEFLAAKNPQYREFYCDYYEPKRVLVGGSKKEGCAVRCDWGAKTKSGAVPLMITLSTFVFDGDRIFEPKRDEKIEWIDGEPTLERKKPNRVAGGN